MQDLLRKLHQAWGVNLSGQKDFTPDDTIRLFGLLFTDDDLKMYIPDLTGDTKDSKHRPKIDAHRGRLLACYQMLLNKFINYEVVVSLPEQWTDPSTKEKVDGQTSEGIYEKFVIFNPNN